ncbi:MAG: hypothetical protein HY294_01575 [Candidatus Rokubacteria bacterium]|nr:hypothetical protein [Candidatus Rokubacteria bacterium]MBI3824670.1 hypothetical protein [Candidatus Rokubacteria bacterium]
MTLRRVLVIALAAMAVSSGCALTRRVLGVADRPEPSVAIKSAESRWLLVQNPRFGDIPSEPEYIWVEEDKIPTTFKSLVRGQRSVIATPEVVAKYGPPPGGGKISPRQGVPYATGGDAASAPRPVTTAAVAPGARGRSAASGVAAPGAKQGYVVYVDTSRIVVDLVAADGLRPGSLVSLRRDRVPIVHPVTGEVLGDLDEEVAVARVTEVRDRFSVAEIQTVASGAQIHVKDRAVLK